METIAIAMFDGQAVFEPAVGCEVYGIDRTAMGVPNFRLQVCAIDPTPIRTGAGFTIDTPYGIEQLRRADTIIVPGWSNFARPVPEDFCEVLRRAHRRGARLLSFCSGAFVLASAGLLDGRRAATHWGYTAAMRERFPNTRWDASVLYVDDDSGIYTSAGTAAAVDLCLHLVRKDYGTTVANVVARRMVVPPHRDGGQAQYVEAPMPVVASDEMLSETLEWALGHLDDDLTVEVMARRANVSPRTFARRFKAVCGTTPLQWLLAQRVLAAQRLLENTDLSVEHIASEVGFGSATSLRTHFARALGTSPVGYRNTFQRAS
jgi:AraC family transcriptional regulator, transcriptional activator FtrA